MRVLQSCLALQQAIAALLADGSLGLLECIEQDLWEETLEEQQEGSGEAQDCLRARAIDIQALQEHHGGQHIRYRPCPSICVAFSFWSPLYLCWSCQCGIVLCTLPPDYSSYKDKTVVFQSIVTRIMHVAALPYDWEDPSVLVFSSP